MSGDRALLLMRLRSRQPDGSVVGERRRVCHLVAVPDVMAVPEFLPAYCGLRIEPGMGELLPSAVGMLCELCMARLPIPASSTLRRLGAALGGEHAEF